MENNTVNIIKIDTPTNSSGLSGNENGAQFYKEHVEKNIDFNAKNEIVFYPSVRLVSESFVQGFFDEILKTKDKKYILDHFVLKTTSDFMNDMLRIYMEKL